MGDKVKEYMDKTLKEESDIWLGIAKEKAERYPNESVRQIVVRTIIEHFETEYPIVMEELDNEIKKKRELSKNEHSSNDDIDIQRVSAMPDGLLTRINRIFQQRGWYRFMSDEAQKEYRELDWFIKEFPRFVIPDKY